MAATGGKDKEELGCFTAAILPAWMTRAQRRRPQPHFRLAGHPRSAQQWRIPIDRTTEERPHAQ